MMEGEPVRRRTRRAWRSQMSTEIKNVIVGTAGHIDHGKSALVEALTGTHPDRLAEEKRRGITIDLGFAFREENGIRFGFVDVPGHERFVSNMLAGAGGMDMVLLVIAADESIKPQTREHLDICSLLGVQRGIVVLTKSDLVDRETLELVKLEAEEYLRGSFLEQAPMIAVSAKTGAGLRELSAAMRDVAAKVREKNARGYFRLPIDRAFAMKGFGAVVTGTLLSGSVRAGDEVELFPERERLRVRGVHSGGKSVEQAVAGQRTAVNLAGIEHTALKRGMSLAEPGKFRTTRRLDARLKLLCSSPRLRERARVHFHSGTLETIAEVHLYEGKELAPGEEALAQLRLQEPALLLRGDRFIIRQFSPVTTVGGGEVLDPLARRPMLRDAGRGAWLRVLGGGTREEILAGMTERAPAGLSCDEIVARTAWLDSEIRAAARQLTGAGRVREVAQEPPVFVSGSLFEETKRKIRERVERFQRENPLLPGIAREDLRASLGRLVRPETFRAALAELTAGKTLEVQGEIVKRAGTGIELLPEEANAKDQIEAAFAAAGLAVPSVKEVLAKLAVEGKRAEKLLQILLREKSLIRVTSELVFHRDALRQLREKLAEYKRAKAERISVPAFKDLTGVTRKYAIPLLEYLDRERVTRRAGDERVIL